MTTIKIPTLKTPKTIILRGFSEGGKKYEEQLFTYNEKLTAMQIAVEWDRKGWTPFLQVQSYDRPTTILYDYKWTAARKNKLLSDEKKVA